MESYYQNTQLPPGFRFYPSDEELITHYFLLKKELDNTFSGRAIADEVDLNKCEPWELPEKAKMGENKWYFFSLRDRKYPTGLRTKRATEAGYWKATGKDREIYSSKNDCGLVGTKKTRVFIDSCLARPTDVAEDFLIYGEGNKASSSANGSNNTWDVPLKGRDDNMNSRANFMQKVSSWITVWTFPGCLLLSNYKHYSSLCNDSLSIWLALLGMLNFTAFLPSLLLMAVSGAHFTRMQMTMLLISAMLIIMKAYVPFLGFIFTHV